MNPNESAMHLVQFFSCIRIQSHCVLAPRHFQQSRRKHIATYP